MARLPACSFCYMALGKDVTMARLVFCEDESSIRRLIQASLRSTPHDVHLAADGAEGLALVEQLRPDAVFTDLRMPNLDGLDLRDALAARPDLAHIPVAVITASAQREEQEAVHASGISNILVKPFSAVALRELVERVLAAA